MAAGLPGVGLSGVFFIISALVAVPLEIMRTVRGESSLARWAVVFRHFALAIVMIGALEIFYAGLRWVADKGSPALPVAHGVLVHGQAPSATHVRTIPLLPILVTVGLIALVMILAKAAQMMATASRRRRPATRSLGAPS